MWFGNVSKTNQGSVMGPLHVMGCPCWAAAVWNKTKVMCFESLSLASHSSCRAELCGFGSLCTTWGPPLEQWFHFGHCTALDNAADYAESHVFCCLIFMIEVWNRLPAVSVFHYCAHLHPLQLQQYQYYSAGLLSTHDPYYEQQRHLLGPKKKKFKEEKKLKGKVTNLMFLNGSCD